MVVDDYYKFTKIKDAANLIHQRVNLIGVVVATNLPRHSKGTDFYCTVRIIDESQPLGFPISFFAETMEKLPRVDTIGDIIQVSNVKVKIFKSEVQALFNKNFSSFALFRRRDCSGREFVPYRTSSNYKPRDQVKKFITGLMKCSIQHKIEDSNEYSSLGEMKEGESLNLLCKILHVCKDNNGEWMLYVWDGTDTPPAPVEAKLEDEMENPLPLQLEPSPLARDILCTFPRVGTVLRVILDQGSKEVGIKFLKPKRWVKIINVKCEARAALWRAVLMPSSKICYLPDGDASLERRKRSYEERVSSKWTRMPSATFPWPSRLTETNHPDAPFVTLRNVLTHPEVTFMFKCVVRVLAILPSRVEDFRSPSGVYRVRLTLEDPTARIHAFLYAEDGIQFLGDLQSVDMLTKKRNMLLGVANEDTLQNVSRTPPWIQCCLKSYYIDKSDVWGSRNYRIFATTLSAAH